MLLMSTGTYITERHFISFKLKIIFFFTQEDSAIKPTLIYNAESFLFTAEQVRTSNIFSSDNSLNYALMIS